MADKNVSWSVWGGEMSQKFDRRLCRELDVRGFQIAMDDAALVRRFQGIHDLVPTSSAGH
jgi:hypothetical protein